MRKQENCKRCGTKLHTYEIDLCYNCEKGIAPCIAPEKKFVTLVKKKKKM